MKTRCIILLLLISVLFFIPRHSSGQIKTGRTFGVNLSSLKISGDGEVVNAKRVLGVNFGLLFDYSLSKVMSLQPRIVFSSKGSDFTFDSVDYSLSPIYLDIPFFFVYTIEARRARISLLAGPYIAVGVGGYKIETDGELVDLDFGSDEYSDVRSFDAGVNIGAGIHIGTIFVSIHYELGLADISTEASSFSDMRNSVIGVSVSSLFARRK